MASTASSVRNGVPQSPPRHAVATACVTVASTALAPAPAMSGTPVPTAMWADVSLAVATLYRRVSARHLLRRGACVGCVCPHVSRGGMAGSSVGTCELCEAGRYKSLSLNAPCIECPAGSCRVSVCVCPTFHRAATPHRPRRDALAGKYTNATGATHCDDCPAGTFQGLAGRTSCISCALGTATNTTGQTSCDLCSAGTYSSSPGSLACDACPLGMCCRAFNLSAGCV